MVNHASSKFPAQQFRKKKNKKKIGWPVKKVKLSAYTALTDYWNMPFGTGYFALRCKAGFVYISPLIIGTEESGQTYTQKKNLKDLPKLEKFLELLHTREKTTIVRKKTSFRSAAKWSFSSLKSLCGFQTMCSSSTGGGERHFILVPYPPPFLLHSFSRDLTRHPVMNGCLRALRTSAEIARW